MTKCKVQFEGKEFESNDFVCVMADNEKGAVMHYHTDALTLGMAVQMIALAYKEELAKLPEEEQKMVTDALLIGGLDE